ncbi:hypothetical protein RR21198_0013 [Rhodococcus rhodochrous ATCC 21198]|nr:hypothetical protein RR21198_0013 [Rhodococcus rhodochrous ATCC 21198]
MTTTIDDDAHNGEPEPLNPHAEYLTRLAEKNRERAEQAAAIDAMRERLRRR